MHRQLIFENDENDVLEEKDEESEETAGNEEFLTRQKTKNCEEEPNEYKEVGGDEKDDVISSDGSYHSSDSDKIYPYQYAVNKATSYYGINDEEKMVNTMDVSNYSKWNDEEILKWIMKLDNGMFVVYKDILSANLKEENVCGADLDNVEIMDIKCWGIHDFKHKKKLFQYIQSLVNKEGK